MKCAIFRLSQVFTKLIMVGNTDNQQQAFLCGGKSLNNSRFSNIIFSILIRRITKDKGTLLSSHFKLRSGHSELLENASNLNDDDDFYRSCALAKCLTQNFCKRKTFPRKKPEYKRKKVLSKVKNPGAQRHYKKI